MMRRKAGLALVVMACVVFLVGEGVERLSAGTGAVGGAVRW